MIHSQRSAMQYPWPFCPSFKHMEKSMLDDWNENRLTGGHPSFSQRHFARPLHHRLLLALEFFLLGTWKADRLFL